jgi:hypothetical protein
MLIALAAITAVVTAAACCQLLMSDLDGNRLAQGLPDR